MERLKKFGSHAIAYAVSGLTAVAGLDPSTVPAEWLPYIGLAGMAATGGHNVFAVIKPKFNPAIKSVFILAVSVLVAASMAGCAFLKPENAALHQIAVQYATGKYIEAANDGEETARACKVIAVSETVATLTSNEAITLDELEAHALAAVVNTNMSPADRILANTLVAAVVAELRARVDTGVLSEQDRYRVGLVLGWVKQAAEMYVPVQANT